MVKIVAEDGHEYHKSATANATEAPTNEATLKNANKSAGLKSEEELELVTIVHYEFSLQGKVEPNKIANQYALDKEWVERMLGKARIIKALEERGVTIKPLDEEGEPAVGSHPTLTPLQLIVANKMLDILDTRPDKKKLTDLGVSTDQYQMWLRDPAFSGYLRERSEALMGDLSHEALLSLADNVRGGKLDAIKYYHEFTGRFVPQSARAVEGTQQVQDLQRMIISIIEIITEEVNDPQEAARITDRLKGLVMGNAIAGTSVVEPITQPEVAKARALTPEVKQLMERGVGYNQ